MSRTEPLLADGVYQRVVEFGRAQVRDIHTVIEKYATTLLTAYGPPFTPAVLCKGCDCILTPEKDKVLVYFSMPDPSSSDIKPLCLNCAEKMDSELSGGGTEHFAERGILIELIRLPDQWPLPEEVTDASSA